MKISTLAVIALLMVGCGDYRTREDITLPSVARLYKDYSGNCKLVLDVGAGIWKSEISIEGKCK